MELRGLAHSLGAERLIDSEQRQKKAIDFVQMMRKKSAQALRGNSYGMERIFNSGGSFFVRDSFGETPLDLLRDFGFENDSDAE